MGGVGEGGNRARGEDREGEGVREEGAAQVTKVLSAKPSDVPWDWHLSFRADPTAGCLWTGRKR